MITHDTEPSHPTRYTKETILHRRGNGEHIQEKADNASYGDFYDNVKIIDTSLERMSGMKTLTLPMDDPVGF